MNASVGEVNYYNPQFLEYCLTAATAKGISNWDIYKAFELRNSIRHFNKAFQLVIYTRHFNKAFELGISTRHVK